MTPRYSEGGQEEPTLQAPTAVQHFSIFAADGRDGESGDEKKEARRHD